MRPAEPLGAGRRRLPASPESLEAVHGLVDAVTASCAGLSAVDRMAFSTAVIEVAANVVRHARPEPGAAVEFAVDLRAWPDLLEAVITETGAVHPGLDGDGRGPRPRASGGPSGAGQAAGSGECAPEDAESGRGLQLVRALVGRISFERRGGENVWSLSRQVREEGP